MRGKQRNNSLQLPGQSRQRGLSLIPVMISIAIFGTLAINYNLPQQQRSLSNKTIDNAHHTAAQLLQAALAYRAETPDWPTAIDVDNFEDDYLPIGIATLNPWGNPWTFSSCPTDGSGCEQRGFVLTTKADTYINAISLASRFGVIARVCKTEALCSSQSANGTYVHIGIAPP